MLKSQPRQSTARSSRQRKRARASPHRSQGGRVGFAWPAGRAVKGTRVCFAESLLAAWTLRGVSEDSPWMVREQGRGVGSTRLGCRGALTAGKAAPGRAGRVPQKRPRWQCRLRRLAPVCASPRPGTGRHRPAAGRGGTRGPGRRARGAASERRHRTGAAARDLRGHALHVAAVAHRRLVAAAHQGGLARRGVSGWQRPTKGRRRSGTDRCCQADLAEGVGRGALGGGHSGRAGGGGWCGEA